MQSFLRFFKSNLTSFLIIVIIYSTLFFHGGFFSCVRIFLCICAFLLIILPKKRIDIDLTMILLFLISFLAVLSSVITSVDSYTAVLEILKYALLFLSYLVFLQLGNYELEKIKMAIYGSFLMLGIFGFLAWSGVLEFADALTANDRRVQSFLQYANTTAFCMSACFLMSLDYLRKKRKFFYALSGFFSIFILGLTRSRTAMILLVMISLLYIFICILKFLKNDNQKIIKFFICTFLLLALAVFVARNYILFLLKTGTFVERLITFQDAINILSHFPLFGIGPGGWQSDHFIYQSGFYAVRYIHNFYLQIALDVGLPSLFLFIVVTIRATIVALKKNDDAMSWIFILLVAGNMLEFHMNFGIIILLFTFSLVWLSQERILFSLNLPRKMWRAVICAIIIAPFSILWISEYQFYLGKRLMDQKKLNKAISAFEWSRTLNPLNYQATFIIARCEPDLNKALQYAFEAYQINPKDLDVIGLLVDGYAIKEDWDSVVRFSEELYRLNPRRVSYQNTLLNAYEKAWEVGILTPKAYEEKILILTKEFEQLETTKNPLYKEWRNN